jgi:hypothetical protein
MRLDHVSYVASHDQISDVVNRIGSQIGTAFVDGGIHPKFGTRNFTAPLLNGQYIEIVCPLDHPATDETPFGKAVKKKADSGGGWLTWVLVTEDIERIEKFFGRKSVDAYRKKPSGEILKWNQIGVSSLITKPVLPFFIKWMAGVHPSKDGQANAAITEININLEEDLDEELFIYVRENWGKSFENQLSFTRNKADEIGITSVKFSVLDKVKEVF